MNQTRNISISLVAILIVIFAIVYYSNRTVDEPAPIKMSINLTPTVLIDEKCANYPNSNLVSLVESDWIDGMVDAPLVVIEYGDFQCPGCAKLSKIMKELKPEYGDKLVRAYRHFPTSPHKYAMMTAEAAEAAGAQGQFWPYHDLLFERQSEWDAALNKEAVRVILVAYAKRLAISDTVPFVNGLGKYQSRVEAHYLSAVYAGVTGNPALFVNGVLYPVKQRPLSLKNVRDFIDLISLNEGKCLGSL